MGVEEGMDFKKSFNNYAGIELINSSVAHIEYFMFKSFV